MIQIKDKAACCGCTACMAICPKDAITMQEDSEGFKYPEIDRAQCVDCHACEHVCPIQNRKAETAGLQKAYLFQLQNRKQRLESTSGGAFTAIASYVIEQGGIVYGAAYDEHLRVHHKSAETMEELRFFRNSKYVQSDMDNVYREIRDWLKAGRLVCFSGTPCQAEGLRSFLSGAQTVGKLILVDVVCHAVPSPLLWRKYIAWQESRLGDIGNIRFRDKRHYGYKYSQMVIEGKDGREKYYAGVESDPFLRAFFSNICDRPSCYRCAFKKRYRESDITLWDCFDVGLKDKRLDDDLGTTNILVHSELGRKALQNIKNGNTTLEIDPDQCVAGAREMILPVPENHHRAKFMQFIAQNTMEDIILQWLPYDWKIKTKKTLRKILIWTGLYGVMKKCIMLARNEKNKYQLNEE